MADPLAIVSLGLTVCQGIVSYYKAWDVRDSETAAIAQKAEGLLNTLNIAQDVIKDEDVENNPALSDLQEKILACRASILELEIKLKKCMDGHLPSGGHHTKAFGKRALYLFRRDGLLSLKDTLDSVQRNLDTAFHAVSFRSQKDQAETFLKALSTEESETRMVVCSLRPDMAAIDAKIQTLALKMDGWMRQSSSQQIIFDPMRYPSPPDQTYQSQYNRSWRPHPTERAGRATSTLYRRAGAVECTCSLITACKDQPDALLRAKPFYRLQRTVHDKSCFFYAMTRKEKYLEAGINYFSRYFGLSLHAALTLTTGARGFSISPRLSFRAVVPDDAPAFCCIKKIKKARTPLDVEHLSRRIIELFNEGKAAPGDTTSDGRTLLHEFCGPVYNWGNLTDTKMFECVSRLLRTLITAGVAINEIARQGTPLDVLLITASHGMDCWNERVYLAVDMIENGGYMSPYRLGMLCYYFPPGFKPLIEKFKNQNGNQNFWPPSSSDTFSELMMIIWSRSEEQLRKLILRNKSVINSVIANSDFTLLMLCVDWPRGVHILIEAGADVNPETYGRSYLDPLILACVAKCQDSIHLLLDAGCCIDWHIIYDVLYPSIADGQLDQVTRTVIAALASRRYQLRALAEDTLPEDIIGPLRTEDGLPDITAPALYAALVDFGVPVNPALKLNDLQRMSVFHTPEMIPEIADELYRAGFKSIDGNDDLRLTPLMNMGSYGFRWGLTNDIRYARWLISKGADSSRIVPDTTASALHQLCSNLGRQFMYDRFPYDLKAMDNEAIDFVQGFLMAPDTDQCLCSCSRQGCRTWTKFLQAMWKNRFRSPPYNRPLADKIFPTFLAFLANMPVIVKNLEIAHETIRFFTFLAMGPRHTCCLSPGNFLLKAMDDEKVIEIRDEEHDLLDELEELVAEFEQEYDTSEQSLTEFLKGYWKQRMEEVSSLKEVIGVDDMQRIRELGVIIAE